MIGNFKIRMIENHIDTQGRWYIHEDNIDKVNKRFHHLQDMHQLEAIVVPPHVVDLFKVGEFSPCAIYQHDVIRPLTVEEYITLGMGLKNLGKKYNKKQDKLI